MNKMIQSTIEKVAANPGSYATVLAELRERDASLEGEFHAALVDRLRQEMAQGNQEQLCDVLAQNNDDAHEQGD